MGYTVYYTFHNAPKGTKRETERKFQRAIADCALIARTYRNENKGTDASLSGYTAHTSSGKYEGLNINGARGNECEDFNVLKTFAENVEHGGEFCKTNEHPYTLVVQACLAILKHHLGDLISVNDDNGDWVDAVHYASKVLQTRINNPLGHNLKLTESRAS